jgi:hypothetical protein
MFRDPEWVYSTLLLGLKESVAVMFQLLCYARMGNYDFFNGALILFVTLTAFGFPFLNSNLFTCLRLGPWYIRPVHNFSYHLLGTFIQILVVAVFQVGGAALASAWWYGMVQKWGMLSKGVDNGMLYKNSSVSGAVYNSIDGRVPIDHESRSAILFDEFAAQAVFMVGVLHIMEAVVPDFFISAVWYKKPQGQPSAEQPIYHTPVPLHFILYVCFLVAGTTRAFPSAHQSPHISVYLLVLGCLGTPGIDTTACWLRIGGGIFSLFFVILYYWVVYGGIWNRKETYRAAADPKPPFPTFMRSLLPTPLKLQSYALVRDRN